MRKVRSGTRCRPVATNLFRLRSQALLSDYYQIDLKNQYSSNQQKIRYFLDVIPDQRPEITLDQFQDTTLYQFLVLGGNVSDDYGLARLALFLPFRIGR